MSGLWLIFFYNCWTILCLQGSLPNRFGEVSSCRPSVPASVISVKKIFMQAATQFLVFSLKDLLLRLYMRQPLVRLHPDWMVPESTTAPASNGCSPSSFT